MGHGDVVFTSAVVEVVFAEAPVFNGIGCIDVTGGILLNADLDAVLNGNPVAVLVKVEEKCGTLKWKINN